MNEVFQALYSGILEERAVTHIARKAISLISSSSVGFSPTWHALGFIHCKLLHVDQGTLRIHIWPKKLRNDAEQKYKIHDHIFSLKSLVICGHLKNITYQLRSVDDADEVDQKLFYVEYLNSGSRLRSSGKHFQSSVVEEMVVRSNEIYNVERGVFHESVVSDGELVATFVATYNHCAGVPQMLGVFESQDDIFRGKVDCPNQEWGEFLVKVLDEISRNE